MHRAWVWVHPNGVMGYSIVQAIHEVAALLVAHPALRERYFHTTWEVSNRWHRALMLNTPEYHRAFWQDGYTGE